MSTTATAKFVSEFVVAALSAAERLGNRPDECGCCDRAGLVHIVKLRHRDGGIVWMGTSCAAKALYGYATTKAADTNRISAEVHAANAAADLAAERSERYARLLVEHKSITVNEAGSDEYRQGLRSYRAMKSNGWTGTVTELFTILADTGEFPA